MCNIGISCTYKTSTIWTLCLLNIDTGDVHKPDYTRDMFTIITPKIAQKD